MKQTTTKALATFTSLVICTGSAVAATISGTGYTADSIVEAGAADAAAGSTFTGAANFVLLQSGYSGTVGSGTIDPASLMPANGLVTTKNGTVFQLASATGNNVLQNGNTFTLNSPAQYSALQFFQTGIGTNNDVGDNFQATLNFSDLSTTVIGQNVDDWQGSRAYDAFDAKTSLIRNNGTNDITNVWMRELQFDLLPADQAKTLDSITFALASRTAVSAVSGTAVPEPSSAALLGLAGLALIVRRRK